MQRFLLALFLFSSVQVFSQGQYFQQDVDYTIDVTLNDRSHILHAFEKINYTNHSRDTLRFIFFHLWPNAYRNDRTAFSEHLVENHETRFYFSKREERGFIDSLKFRVNNEEVNVSEYNNHTDIVLLELLNPLAPGGTIEITTPFRVVIPEVFSRMGHHEQAYQISQWYPKPAVYDAKGWHPMPYLDQGEFYSEYGNFTVNITLPANYVTAATGDLQTDAEKKFIQSRILQNDTTLLRKLTETPASDAQYKTITYTQQHVHDFAWFANKQFVIEKTIDTLASGKQTDCYSFFTPEDKRYYYGSSQTIAQTIHYLSTHVGEYPYRQASVVAGYLLAGGGMEYPNVTVIGRIDSRRTLQTVIIHEVGHNWFYGLLGSNERDHPWMDEGVNSYYENVMNKLFDKRKKSASAVESIENDGVKMLYPLTAKQRLDQPIELPAAAFTKTNYGGIVYGKTASMFKYLAAYLGEAMFEQCMKAYFAKWHFKHPQPEDMRAVFEKESGKNLAWFFEDGIQTTKQIDFAVQHASFSQDEVRVKIKNRSSFSGPAPVSIYAGDSLIATQWIEAPWLNEVTFAYKGQPATRVVVNGENHLPEIKINNNVYRKSGLFHRSRVKVKFLTGLGLKQTQNVYILPSVGYNVYDKVMLGGVLHNIRIPNNAFQFALSPLYSFGTKQLVGTGIAGYSFFPKGLQKVTLAIQGNSFHHASSSLNIAKPLYLRHIKIAPSISIDFAQKNMRGANSDNFLFKYYHIMHEEFSYHTEPGDSVFKPQVEKFVSQWFLNGKFTHKNKRTFNPFSYEMNAIGNAYFLKLGLTTNLRIDYHMKNKALYFRAYAGKFFDFKNAPSAFTNRPQYLNATHTDKNDYLYDETYVARNQQQGTLSQQISMQEGGMKIKTNLYAAPLGENDNWLAAVNLKTDIPVKIPIRLPLKFQLFVDACSFAKADKLNPSGAKMLYDAGLQVNLFNDLFVLYAPLLMSKDYTDYGKSMYGKKRFQNMLTFSLNLSKLNLLKTQEVTSILGL